MNSRGRIFTVDELWRSIPRSFWANVQKSDMCDWLVEKCAYLVGCDNVFILTAPIRVPDCSAGKVEWIQRFLPMFLHDQFMIGRPKYLCANQESLLIDDSDSNVNDFRRAGGRAVLVPRPWNSARDRSSKLMVMNGLTWEFC
jgi:5'(3')-deoxyribonucleotidase